MLLVPENWTALFLSHEYEDFTKTLELYGNNNTVFYPKNYIAAHMTVCVSFQCHSALIIMWGGGTGAGVTAVSHNAHVQ